MAGEQIAGYSELTKEDGYLFTYTRPIFRSDGSYAATACVDFSMDYLSGMDITFTVQLALILVGIGILVLIVDIFIVRRRVTRPINALSGCASHFAYETEEDRKQNIENTLYRLLELGVLPIINENDTVTTDEIVIGDNDTLSAIVSVLVKADLLVLLSDIDGLYTKDPHKHADAELISTVTELTPEIIALGGGRGSSLGTGGMATKLHAAQIATEAGTDMIIANGSRPQLLYQIADGEPVGTRFIGRK